MSSHISWRQFVVAVVACASGATLWMPTAAHAANYTMFKPANIPGYCIRHAYWLGEISPCPTGSDADFAFRQVPGLARFIVSDTNGLISFESKNFPGWYLRHEYGRIKLAQVPSGGDDSYALFAMDASFYRKPGLSGASGGVSFRSCNYPTQWLRHSDYHLWISEQTSWNLANDATFQVVAAP
ncbi:AbfB domain-containing protein [Nonomuraea sp. NPDC026600]|uniref:AbfB domain-containing protein n=1 Tax=Nonomuraea sp. NPDC026600 TaxID=3155363 RepID=UPI003401B130